MKTKQTGKNRLRDDLQAIERYAVQERVTRLRERRADAGLVRVEVWVPADARDRLLRYGRRLRGDAGAVQ